MSASGCTGKQWVDQAGSIPASLPDKPYFQCLHACGKGIIVIITMCICVGNHVDL